MGVGLAGTAQHVAALDHIGTRSAATAAAAAATATTPATASPAAAAAAAAVAGSTPAAGGAGDHLAAGHVHRHGATAGHCLGGGGRADLGSGARGFVVAGARCLGVERRLRVGVGAGAAEREADGGVRGPGLGGQGSDAQGPCRAGPLSGRERAAAAPVSQQVVTYARPGTPRVLGGAQSLI